MNRDVIQKIDYDIKTAWIGKIADDYKNDFILKEDTLKSCFYHHLRNSLDTLCKEQNLRIYTEFNEKGLKAKGWRADIAIVRLHEREQDSCYLGDYVRDVLAIIELKFQTKGSRGMDNIWHDIEKAKDYIRYNRFPDCQYYLSIIHEDTYPFSELQWLNEREASSWGKGRLTELNACSFNERDETEVGFSVLSYNELNTEFNCGDIGRIQFVCMK